MSEVAGYLGAALVAALGCLAIWREIRAARVPEDPMAGVFRHYDQLYTEARAAVAPVLPPPASWWARTRRRRRSALCLLIHAKHELYRAHDDARLFQRCLLCGHETSGWRIDRRDRRPNLSPSGVGHEHG